MEKQTLKERKEAFIDNLRFQKYEAEVNLVSVRDILPEMQEAKVGMQRKIDISKDFIAKMEESPIRESREKKQKEEKNLKVLEQKMEDQVLQIDGGKRYNSETKKDEVMAGVITRIEAFETTIKNLGIFIRNAEKLK